jgi:hypothetical protein
MLRNILLKHPHLVQGVLFFVVVSVIGWFIAPYIVRHYGLAGTAIGLLSLLVVAYEMERRRM